MADNEYLGSAAVVKWITSGGTLTLQTEYRVWNYTPTIELVDATAGADGNRRRINSFKDGSARLTMLDQTSAALAEATALVEGQIGTITYQPSGTAVGRLIKTIPAISQGMTYNSPYADVVSIDIAWQQNGTRVDGTN